MSERTPALDPDLALLERVRDADPGAVDELMTRYSARVYRLAFGITRSHADAEEVVQDVFLAVVGKVHGFEGRAALGSWIYRITTNLSLNKRRGKRAELESSLEAMLPTFQPDGHRDGDRTYLLADWSANPEETLLSGEARATLMRALDRLPQRYRAILVLRDVEGASNDEIAESLGETVASVKSRLHRARMALREALTAYWTTAGGADVGTAAGRAAGASAGRAISA